MKLGEKDIVAALLSTSPARQAINPKGPLFTTVSPSDICAANECIQSQEGAKSKVHKQTFKRERTKTSKCDGVNFKDHSRAYIFVCIIFGVFRMCTHPA